VRDVAVIVATHDRPQMLEVALHSILGSVAMVRDSVQVLVVDDASQDAYGNEAICTRLGVDYLHNERNLGVGATLARGYDATDSEFSMFWGDDDFMLPSFLPLHLERIREGHDAVSSSYYRADLDLRIVREVRLPRVTFGDLMKGRCSAVDVSLLRRSSLPPWRPERERAMLMTMWLALTDARRSIATIREPTWLYRRHPDQLSRTKPSEHDMALRVAAMDEYRVAA
jgi:glycosyltransferase involved in cell wall biosynthesis